LSSVVSLQFTDKRRRRKKNRRRERRRRERDVVVCSQIVYGHRI